MGKKWTFELGDGKECKGQLGQKVRPLTRIVDFMLKILKSQSDVAWKQC